jgi:hypothetical protein
MEAYAPPRPFGSLTFILPACDMGKHKKKHISSSRKFKELQGHVDGLAEEVLEIERAYLLYSRFRRVVIVNFFHRCQRI